ncbi:MAG: NAD-dependent epimerase/dehydratase family protein [Solirubrobacterales bacterium]|nr:NAD-dependent epimerase/dehydratase family protein [Solirubrobacterales bacterium]
MAERILVTGPDGLLGAAAVGALLARGDEVVLLRRPGPRRPSVLALDGLQDRCTVVAGELADVGDVLCDQHCGTVLHLAAQTQVGAAVEDPLATFETNLRGTWRVLEACRTASVGRVVIASSDKVYGTAARLPVAEDAPLLARELYEVSKAGADMIARSYAAAFELPVAVLRLPNVYGPGDPNAARLIPAVCAALLASRRPRIRSDGSPRRDFLHVDDAVAALLAVPADGEPYNASGGATHSLREIVDGLVTASGTAGLDAEYADIPTPPGEQAAGWLDASRLIAATGWAPRTPLADGLAATYAWYAAHPGFLAA